MNEERETMVEIRVKRIFYLIYHGMTGTSSPTVIEKPWGISNRRVGSEVDNRLFPAFCNFHILCTAGKTVFYVADHVFGFF